jgi:phage regulator Rha-like protein
MSAWQEWKKNVGDTRPWHILYSEHVANEVSDQRLNICKSCPELIKTINQCKKCGCLMNIKTKIATAECPLGKW